MSYTGNDLYPRTLIELLLATLLFLIAYILNGELLGDIAVLIANSHKKEHLLAHHIENMNNAAGRINLPVTLSQEIKEYMESTKQKSNLQEELNHFIGMIGPRIRLKVSWHIFKKMFYTNSVL